MNKKEFFGIAAVAAFVTTLVLAQSNTGTSTAPTGGTRQPGTTTTAPANPATGATTAASPIPGVAQPAAPAPIVSPTPFAITPIPTATPIPTLTPR